MASVICGWTCAARFNPLPRGETHAPATTLSLCTSIARRRSESRRTHGTSGSSHPRFNPLSLFLQGKMCYAASLSYHAGMIYFPPAQVK